MVYSKQSIHSVNNTPRSSSHSNHDRTETTATTMSLSRLSSFSSNSSTTTETDEDAAGEKRCFEIEPWLVNLTVQRHDDLCALFVAKPSRSSFSTINNENNKTKQVKTPVHRLWGLFGFGWRHYQHRHHDSVKDSSAAATTTTERIGSIKANKNKNECSICACELHVGDVVSWSPNKLCDHVFHHKCLRHWLLHYNSCPVCDQAYLPGDDIKKKKEKAAKKDLPRGGARRQRQHQQQQPLATEVSYRTPPDSLYAIYCTQCGLVRPKTALRCCTVPKPCTKTRLEEEEEKLIDRAAQEVPEHLEWVHANHMEWKPESLANLG